MATEYRINYYLVNIPGMPSGHAIVEFGTYNTVTGNFSRHSALGYWPEQAFVHEGNVTNYVYGPGVVENDVDNLDLALASGKYSKQSRTVSEQQYLDAQLEADSAEWNEGTYNFFGNNCADYLNAIYKAAGGIGESFQELWGSGSILDQNGNAIGPITLYTSIKYSGTIISNVAEVFFELVTLPVVGGIKIIDGILDAIDAIGDLSINDLFEISFGSDKVTDTSEKYFTRVEPLKYVSEAGGTINGPAPQTYIDEETNESFSIYDGATTTTINGITRSLGSVVKSVESAANQLGNFLSDVADKGVEWFTDDSGAAQLSFATWLAANMEDLINGDIEIDEALIGLAKHLGQDFLADYLSRGPVNDVLGAKAMLKDVFKEFGLENPGAYADALYLSLGRMAIDFVANGFDAGAAAKAGMVTLAGAFAQQYLKEIGFTAVESASAIAAITTAVHIISDFENFNSLSDIAKAGVQIGLATAFTPRATPLSSHYHLPQLNPG